MAAGQWLPGNLMHQIDGCDAAAARASTNICWPAAARPRSPRAASPVLPPKMGEGVSDCSVGGVNTCRQHRNTQPVSTRSAENRKAAPLRLAAVTTAAGGAGFAAAATVLHKCCPFSCCWSRAAQSAAPQAVTAGRASLAGPAAIKHSHARRWRRQGLARRPRRAIRRIVPPETGF